jgi:Family of unknown function (DUF6000)
MIANPDGLGDLEKHIAGATVTHRSPFSGLEVHVSKTPLTQTVMDWVRSLYFGLHRKEAESFLHQHFHEIDTQLITSLLEQFNWRPRIVGAYLVALSGANEFTEWIGKLLLRSDVCYAGKGYCVVLAALNSEASVKYLVQYTEYYLQQPDLFFDQDYAMAALRYLDRENSTALSKKFSSAWAAFVHNKPQWDLNTIQIRFESEIAQLSSLRNHHKTH